GLMYGVGMAGLMHIDTLQATGGEDDFFAHWSGYQARELLARQRFSELGYVIAALPTVFLIVSNAVVLGLGGWQVMSGAMTVGMMMAFYVMSVNFLAPIGHFVQLADLFQTLEADLQRLDDLLDTPEDKSLQTSQPHTAKGRAAEIEGRLRLGGRIELRDITFGYQANREPLLENFSLTINPGQRVAIVGASGAGKSTLSALVGGIYPPWSGEILFDGHPRERIPRELLTSSISMVDQRIFLFAATVRDNLTMWRPETPDEDILLASRDAAIHEEIMSRTRGYDSHVQERGRNFSGGQRQRLEIARALVPNPSVLIMDEATSVLDAINEMRIDDALRRRGCSCLIIAHRLSTIRDCDLIVVLDKGKEIQRGTHQSLMAQEDGMYKSLMDAN
ncbi:MAG: ATP-binding cassette domain-containing protein, partial [bacterium]